MTDIEEKFSNVSKNIINIFEEKEGGSKSTFSSEEAKTFKREIDNIKLGNYPQTNNEDIDGQYLRELLDKKRHEHDPDYISHIPVGETKKYKEDNKIYALLKEEHQKVADYRNFQEFVDSKIREEKSKKVPSLRLIDQYKIASSWYENLMIIKEWEMELLES